MRIAILLPIMAIVASACSGVSGASSTPAASPKSEAVAAGQLIHPGTSATLRSQFGFAFPEAPTVPEGPADEALVATIEGLFSTLRSGVDVDALQQIATSGDARAAWLLADLLRFLGPSNARDVSLAGYEQLTGTTLDADPVADRSPWQSITDHLIAWDLPALTGYEVWKAQLFTLIEPRWQPFFDDRDADIDWRLVSWGGVLMDARPLGDPGPCPSGCIPALDDPAVTDAAGGSLRHLSEYIEGCTFETHSTPVIAGQPRIIGYVDAPGREREG